MLWLIRWRLLLVELALIDDDEDVALSVITVLSGNAGRSR